MAYNKTPFKMMGKSPLAKKLTGGQGNLPLHLQEAIKDSPAKQSPLYKQDKNYGLKEHVKTIGEGLLNLVVPGGSSTISNIYNKVKAKDASTGTSGGLKVPSVKKTVSNMLPYSINTPKPSTHETKHGEITKQKENEHNQDSPAITGKELVTSEKKRTMTKTLKPLRKRPHSRPVTKIKAEGIVENVKTAPKAAPKAKAVKKNVKTAPFKHTTKKNGKSKSARHLGLHEKHGTHDKFPSVGDRLGKVVNKVKDVALDVKDKVVDNVNDLVTTVKNGDSPAKKIHKKHSPAKQAKSKKQMRYEKIAQKAENAVGDDKMKKNARLVKKGNKMNKKNNLGNNTIARG